jgi:hypothetical protein
VAKPPQAKWERPATSYGMVGPPLVPFFFLILYLIFKIKLKNNNILMGQNDAF